MQWGARADAATSAEEVRVQRFVDTIQDSESSWRSAWLCNTRGLALSSAGEPVGPAQRPHRELPAYSDAVWPLHFGLPHSYNDRRVEVW